MSIRLVDTTEHLWPNIKWEFCMGVYTVYCIGSWLVKIVLYNVWNIRLHL